MRPPAPRRLLAAAGLAALGAGLFWPLDLAYVPAWGRALVDAAHLPAGAAVFAALALAWGPGWRAGGPRLALAVAALAVNGLAELIQPLVGRAAGWADFAAGGGGVLLAWLWTALPRPAPKFYDPERVSRATVCVLATLVAVGVTGYEPLQLWLVWRGQRADANLALHPHWNWLAFAQHYRASMNRDDTWEFGPGKPQERAQLDGVDLSRFRGLRITARQAGAAQAGVRLVARLETGRPFDHASATKHYQAVVLPQGWPADPLSNFNDPAKPVLEWLLPFDEFERRGPLPPLREDRRNVWSLLFYCEPEASAALQGVTVEFY